MKKIKGYEIQTLRADPDGGLKFRLLRKVGFWRRREVIGTFWSEADALWAMKKDAGFPQVVSSAHFTSNALPEALSW